MKFKYDIEKVVQALDYNDLKGLLILIDSQVFSAGEPSVSEMEELLIKKIEKEPIKRKRQLDSLILSCARVNSIGY